MGLCINCFKDCEGRDVCSECGYVQSTDKREIYHLKAGTILYDKYVIGKVLGSGGFGNTYKAWDLKLERCVAVKEYYPSGLVNRKDGSSEVVIYNSKRAKEYEHGKERFLDEARNTAKFIEVKNIVDVYDFFEENNTAYFVMEFLDGISLSSYLKNTPDGRIDVEKASDIVIKVASALEEVHKAGIIHRDVAPDNIFLCQIDGVEVVKLIDFGAARFSRNEEELLTVILKPGYAPPEQYIRGNEQGLNEQGPWTDVYALGATMYHMLIGLKAEESINRKVEDTVPYPHEIDPTISENLSNAIMTAMAVDKHMRFQNITDFKRAVSGEKKVSNIRKQKKKKAHKRMLGIAFSALVLLVGFGVFYFFWSRQKAEETLPEATIEVWCIADDSINLQERFKNIIEEFISGYDSENVVINVTTFSGEEYCTKLREAIEQNEAPDLFESTDLSEEYLADAVNLSGVMKGYYKDKCAFYKEYCEWNDGYKKVPLAFNYKVTYINTVLWGKKYSYISPDGREESFDSLCEKSGADKSLISNRYDAFIKGEEYILNGSTNQYMSLVKNMAGKYKLLVMDDQLFTKEEGSGFTYEWSVMGDNADEKDVATKLLKFMLSEYALTELEVSPNRNMLPVNKDTLNNMVTNIFNELYYISEKVK